MNLNPKKFIVASLAATLAANPLMSQSLQQHNSPIGNPTTNAQALAGTASEDLGSMSNARRLAGMTADELKPRNNAQHLGGQTDNNLKSNLGGLLEMPNTGTPIVDQLKNIVPSQEEIEGI